MKKIDDDGFELPKNGRFFSEEEIDRMIEDMSDDEYQRLCEEEMATVAKRRKRGWMLAAVVWVVYIVVMLTAGMLRIEVSVLWGNIIAIVVSTLVLITHGCIKDGDDDGGGSSFMPRNPRYLRRKLRQRFVKFK